VIEVNLPTLFVVALFAALGAYFGAYLRAKGKNLATREDLDPLVRTTAAIKAEISGELWVKQKLWDVKLRSWTQLVENLGELAASIEGFRRFLGRSSAPKTEDENQHCDAELREQNQTMRTAVESVRRSASVARLVVAAKYRTLLSQIADQWNETVALPPTADQLNRQVELGLNAWIQVLDAAREDLGGPQ
jgi:hypothetical protein